MEELEVLIHYKEIVHTLYEHVKARIRTQEGLSECFGSDISIKQGCPLSLTLFGLYIDKLEKWINRFGGEGMHLAKYMVKLLMYADDVILVAKMTKDLEDHLRSIEFFFTKVEM